MSLVKSRTKTFATILLSGALMMSCGIVQLPNDAWKQQPINTLPQEDKAKAWALFRKRAMQLANQLYTSRCLSNGGIATMQTQHSEKLPETQQRAICQSTYDKCMVRHDQERSGWKTRLETTDWQTNSCKVSYLQIVRCLNQLDKRGQVLLSDDCRQFPHTMPQTAEERRQYELEAAKKLQQLQFPEHCSDMLQACNEAMRTIIPGMSGWYKPPQTP